MPWLAKMKLIQSLLGPSGIKLDWGGAGVGDGAPLLARVNCSWPSWELWGLSGHGRFGVCVELLIEGWLGGRDRNCSTGSSWLIERPRQTPEGQACGWSSWWKDRPEGAELVVGPIGRTGCPGTIRTPLVSFKIGSPQSHSGPLLGGGWRDAMSSSPPEKRWQSSHDWCWWVFEPHWLRQVTITALSRTRRMWIFFMGFKHLRMRRTVIASRMLM